MAQGLMVGVGGSLGSLRNERLGKLLEKPVPAGRIHDVSPKTQTEETGSSFLPHSYFSPKADSKT